MVKGAKMLYCIRGCNRAGVLECCMLAGLKGLPGTLCHRFPFLVSGTPKRTRAVGGSWFKLQAKASALVAATKPRGSKIMGMLGILAASGVDLLSGHKQKINLRS